MDRTRHAFCRLMLAGALLAALGIAWPAHAETRTWTGAGDNEWFNADNWNPVGPPAPADDLTIDTGTPETAGAVTVDDNGSITVTGGAHAAFGNPSCPEDFIVGNWHTGTLIIEAGGQVSNLYGCLGYFPGSTGAVTVTGAGSTWTNSGSLDVGWWGAGTLTVSDGGLVTAQTLSASPDDLFGNGTITVNGAVLDADLVFDSTHGPTQSLPFGAGGTLNLKVDGTGGLGAGHKGTGTLRIAEGRSVASTVGYLGYSSGSTGTATVTGAGSTWTNAGLLYVGHRGAGTLTVSDGGLVTAQTLYASSGDLFGNGTITVNGAVLDADLVFDSTHGPTQSLPFGAGGTLNLNVDGTGGLGAGHKGTGTLRIAEGRSVASTVGYLGHSQGSTGTATVTGAGSTWTNGGALHVGDLGTGTLTVEAGGQVSNSNGYLGEEMRSTGTVTVTGGGSTWTNGGALYVGYWGTGMLTVEAGGQVNSDGAYLGHTLFSTGTVTVTGAGSTWTNSGSLYVGDDGAGTLTIEAGGQVSDTDAYLGNYWDSTGTATVTGTGSTWTHSANLNVGSKHSHQDGTGSVTVENGGQLLVGERLSLWRTDSEVTVNAGTVTAGVIEGPGTIRITDPVGGTALTVGSFASGYFYGALLDDTGPGSLTKVGPGWQTLAGPGITYTGTTTILEGTLRLFDTTAFASGILNGATTEFWVTASTWIFDEALGGAGTFIKSGDGTLVISGPQDYDAGATFDILGGTVEMNTDASGTGLIADADLSILVADATLNFGCDQHLDTLTIDEGGLVRLTGAGVVVVKNLVMNGVPLGPMTLTPEPATLVLLAAGGICLALTRRRARTA